MTQASVLVVDDNEASRLIVNKLLSPRYQVATADDGAQCLDCLQSREFTCILLDLNMPVKSGFDVLEELQQQRSASRPPIIVVSADREADSISRALQLGAADYVTTPFNKDELLARVATQIKLYSRERHLEHLVEDRTRALVHANKQLRETHAQLIQAEKMVSLGQLAAGVAHEINNPVGYIGVNLESLQAYLGDLENLVDGHQHPEFERLKEQHQADFVLEDAQQLISESLDGVRRVKQIVVDLKGFSRPDDQVWEEADVHRLIDSTLNIIHHQIKYHATLCKDYAELPALSCCAAQISQVLLNLLVNASQALGPTGGSITIRTRQPDPQHLAITVADNGCGIAPEALHKIFDPFYTTKPVGEGTGLGLSVSFGIVQKHGGRIDVVSRPGDTRFTVILPIAGPQG